MNSFQIEAKLKEIKGSTVIYKTVEHTIANFNVDGEAITIVTNKRFITTTKAELPELIANFLPVASPALANNELKENTAFDEMLSIMKDNIKRVQENPEYVRQATVVNKSVQTTINLMQTKINYVKTINKY